VKNLKTMARMGVYFERRCSAVIRTFLCAANLHLAKSNLPPLSRHCGT